MIACQACGYNNPLGRVFCQKCGTKLDLSKVRPPGQGDDQGGVTVGVRKEEKKQGKALAKTLIRIFDVLLVLVIAFCLYEVWQEPWVKTVGSSSIEADKVKQDREKLEFAIANKHPFRVVVSDMGLNSYLATVSDIGKSSDTGSMRTEKIILLCQKDLVDVVYIRRIVLGSWQKNIVLQYWGRPLVEGGEFRFQPVRGAIGDLKVPPFALGMYERNFARLFQNFDAERTLLGKLSQIEVESERVTLAYEPAK